MDYGCLVIPCLMLALLIWVGLNKTSTVYYIWNIYAYICSHLRTCWWHEWTFQFQLRSAGSGTALWEVFCLGPLCASLPLCAISNSAAQWPLEHWCDVRVDSSRAEWQCSEHHASYSSQTCTGVGMVQPTIHGPPFTFCRHKGRKKGERKKKVTYATSPTNVRVPNHPGKKTCLAICCNVTASELIYSSWVSGSPIHSCQFDHLTCLRSSVSWECHTTLKPVTKSASGIDSICGRSLRPGCCCDAELWLNTPMVKACSEESVKNLREWSDQIIG